jgi:hypothetical protein
MVINYTIYLDVKSSCNSLLKTLEDGNLFAETYVGAQIHFIYVNKFVHLLVGIRLMIKCTVHTI